MLEDLSHRQGNGHKVTMKFKAALNSVKDKAKPLLKRYDDIDEELTGERVNRKYEKIIDLKDSFWVTSSAGLDFRALRAYMNKCRAEEELIVLEKEERRVRNYSKQRCESLEIAIMNNDRSAGEKILLYHRLLDAELLYRKAHGAQRTRGETFVVPGQPPKLMQTFGDDEDLGDDVLDDRQGRKENGDDDVEDVDDAEDDDDDFEDEEPVAYVHADEAT
ncbi:hypothetical protein BJV82DRAFT_629151 [Fennellomyces sp. T-0311]|nr:hypothetical protein BJV82DRAFT_629151 [Fennellomyces sp. T-0311]